MDAPGAPAGRGRAPATLKRLARDLPDGPGPLSARLVPMRLHEVALEPWEDVVDPAGGDLDVFLACAARSPTCCTS